MSILNDVIAIFSPAAALRREYASSAYRQIRGYEAAKKSRTHKANKEGRSANDAVFAAGKSIREQARWLDENHDLSIGILDRLSERVIGANGIIIEPQPRDMQGELLTELADDLQRRFANWSLSPDITGEYSRPELERLALRSALRDGEVFGQCVRGKAVNLTHPNPQGTAFSIEALEADFVPFAESKPAEGVRQGIRTNAWGQVTAYIVSLDHPADTAGYRLRTKEIKADSMLHLAFRRRLHQRRGVSLFHGILTRLSDIKDYEESERVAARIAAALAFYIKRGNPDMYTGQGAASNREIPIAPGMTFDDLQPGEDVGMIESNRPNVHLSEFRNGQLKAAASGAMSSYSSISRDYKGSYSSQRQELVEQDESNRILQQWFTARWSRPVYRAWLQMELLNRDDPLVLPDNLDPRSLYDAVYFGPTMPWIDPRKEAEGWEMMIAGNVATEADWARARGRNPTEVKRQRKREVEFNRDNDMVTANDPQQGDPIEQRTQRDQSRTDRATRQQQQDGNE